MNNISDLLLGKSTEYSGIYNKRILTPIPREIGRRQIGVDLYNLPFSGLDIWNCYEISWLNNKGKPEVRIIKFVVPWDSENIVESKSVKLYLNSFNDTKFADEQTVLETITLDISETTRSLVMVEIIKLEQFADKTLSLFSGECLDRIDIDIDDYHVNAKLLELSSKTEIAEEELFSNLLKTNCLITNQPDWASIYIKYKGFKINHEHLLKYIISFRNHNEFHEQCVERIFCNIMDQCHPFELTVYAKYTRRGGIDINPYRTNIHYQTTDIDIYRDVRQ